MRSIVALSILVILIVSGSLWYGTSTTAKPITGQLSAVAAASGDTDPRWQRVTAPRPFTFPIDHGPHPEYQTEWWYYTGNLQAEDGREFGFQLTFFRRGLDPEPTPRASQWATDTIFLAHFAVTDITGERFYAAERFSRDGAGLAGASGDPYRVFIDDWQVTGSGVEGMTMRLEARTEDMAIDLELRSSKPPTLQGDRGFSTKGTGEGNASYYYSLTRMETTGQVSIEDTTYDVVAGTSWMDHEWGTSRLESDGVGWDWFALQLDDGREITWAQIRRANGTANPASFGMLTGVDGTTTPLQPDDIELRVTSYWTSPRSGARYPAGWQLRIPRAELDLVIMPRVAAQELPVSIVYWEGAVGVRGTLGADAAPLTGRGYVELTGYVPNGERVPGR